MKITTNDPEVFDQKPLGFTSTLEVVGCFLECQGKYLFVKRAAGTSEELLWGIPGGKVEKGESLPEALIREMNEETSITLTPSELEPTGLVYIQKSYIQFTFHLFRVKRETFPEVILNHEHEDSCWVTYEDALNLPLMSGAPTVCEYYSNFIRR